MILVIVSSSEHQDLMGLILDRCVSLCTGKPLQRIRSTADRLESTWSHSVFYENSEYTPFEGL